MSRDAKVVDGWDFNRIIPCPGTSSRQEGRKRGDRRIPVSWNEHGDSRFLIGN
ncbi:uncharacterized protein EI90DRAFT_3071456 [Cantharellus anzutake]|uniref:uncharacterized protein n=1 Tax=Cantharellus anzutake TaxID=1750568 RepID=UPI001906F0EC|nr:uncharacterized protein EI90DRAFT_3071456 [Cantharellus anzutake]KAF8326088.1 hypothetical protein EI90DRAFT_3071456 [Cantharellus anzutake]